ncbi:DUF2513 domain-containing protein [Klebsiella pasteurii]|uniref:DUF2513 domain-containing protein n=1 Tax=Klebsiella pasteurii TaxID=2587529 RepID=UPI003AB2DF12
MKRDMDLLRRMVLCLQDNSRRRPLTALDGVDQRLFNYHALLLVQANIAVGTVEPVQAGIPMKALLFELTWEGQDFADSIRNDTVWEKAKENVIKPVAGWSFSILKDYLKAELTKYLPPL